MNAKENNQDLDKKDQYENQKLLDLKNAIDEGLESERSNLKIGDIIRMVDREEL